VFFHLRWREGAVLRGYVAVVHKLEACTEHSLVHFKQHAVINFWLLKESLQLKFTADCRLFMMTVSMWGLYIAGPKNVSMANQEGVTCVINNEVHDLRQQTISFKKWGVQCQQEKSRLCNGHQWNDVTWYGWDRRNSRVHGWKKRTWLRCSWIRRVLFL